MNRGNTLRVRARRTLAPVVLGFALVINAPSSAFAKVGKAATIPGFALKPGSVRIVLMRPSVHVGANTTGGVYRANAEWTASARDNITAALKEAAAKLGNTVVEYDEGASAEGPVVQQYSSLFGAVSKSVIEYQFFPGNRLPTKKRKGQFEWSLGPGVTRLKSLEGADYALFVSTYDAYGSAARKALQIFGAMAGIAIVPGVHEGHASLVDLKTGQLVWLSAQAMMGGDVREADGATKRVRELLSGFPGQSASAPASAKAR